MIWLVVYDCANLGVKTPLEGEMVKPEHVKSFDTESELRKYLRKQWLKFPISGNLHFLEEPSVPGNWKFLEKSPISGNLQFLEKPFKKDLALEKKLKEDMDKFVSEHADADWLAKTEPKSLADEIKNITLNNDEDEKVVNMLCRISTLSENNYDETKETDEDVKKRDDYISNLLEKLPLNCLVSTRFQGNTDCCQLHLYKSETDDIQFTREDMLTLFPRE